MIGNHVDRWRGNAGNAAVFDCMDEVCGRLDTSGATYTDVIAWMELQDPAVPAGLQARPPVW
ncbi:MAG TPA: hypothetical protein VJM49_07445 [Acidimicrobiales bacterium]|nr:hypothetical protein [Acidimicrobiales bacterium]